jgi:hypothetical protein
LPYPDFTLVEQLQCQQRGEQKFTSVSSSAKAFPNSLGGTLHKELKRAARMKSAGYSI